MNRLLAYLILEAVGNSGSYNPSDTLYSVEDMMTLEEYNTAEGFLAWCHANHKEFGTANIHDVFKQYERRNE